MTTKSKKALYICSYTAIVVILLLLARCERSVTITTPEKDVQYIAHRAETIRTEADLREIEKLATKYELAYRNSMGGAEAMRFKTLVEPVMIKAGAQRDAARAEEELYKSIVDSYNSRLDDLEEAWSMEIPSREDMLAKIEANNLEIEALEDAQAQLIKENEILAYEIIDAGYPEDMLAKSGEIEASIVATTVKIAEVKKHNEIIELAYLLQCGEKLIIEEPCEEFSMED